IHVPFVEHMGLQLLEKNNGTVRMRLDPRPEFENSWGSMHGGALLTLLDVALASAGRSLDPQCNGAATVEIKVNFIAAAKGAVLAEGRAQRAGRSLIFSEGELRSEDGTLLAKATGTFKLLYPKE
ncbi:MAG: PaaI family thioesterase, partial [Terriglobales bacterium]